MLQEEGVVTLTSSEPSGQYVLEGHASSFFSGKYSDFTPLS